MTDGKGMARTEPPAAPTAVRPAVARGFRMWLIATLAVLGLAILSTGYASSIPNPPHYDCEPGNPTIDHAIELAGLLLAAGGVSAFLGLLAGKGVRWGFAGALAGTLFMGFIWLVLTVQIDFSYCPDHSMGPPAAAIHVTSARA